MAKPGSSSFRSGELSYFRLATLHNLRFMARLMATIRAAISGGKRLSLDAIREALLQGD
ncbi:MAG: hypothetical protein XD60_0558 [Acetothermia bacterium 64_32]|nr:MAG: hypothetical protein XD60_0558 [Acetothermia bacterium 64_32]HAF71185.1 hypothetical protein [Candidatus Acetothermia bacterium]